MDGNKLGTQAIVANGAIIAGGLLTLGGWAVSSVLGPRAKRLETPRSAISSGATWAAEAGR